MWSEKLFNVFFKYNKDSLLITCKGECISGVSELSSQILYRNYLQRTSGPFQGKVYFLDSRCKQVSSRKLNFTESYFQTLSLKTDQNVQDGIRLRDMQRHTALYIHFSHWHFTIASAAVWHKKCLFATFRCLWYNVWNVLLGISSFEMHDLLSVFGSGHIIPISDSIFFKDIPK